MLRQKVPPRCVAPLPLRLVAAACALLVGTAQAADQPSGGTYVLTKEVIAAGGGYASGGSYALVATVGQSVAGQTDAQPYVKQQGFHAAITPRPDGLFNDSFEERI